MLAAKLLGRVGEEKLYVDDVFSAYTYTGNGANGRLIQTGIDLSGKGGLVITKSRVNLYAGGMAWVDTARGAGNTLFSASTGGTTNPSDLTFNSNGHTVSWVNRSDWNTNADTYASWTFRKAPKFFDVVTYTGTGTAGLTVSHSLGIKPGMIIVKRTDTTGNWAVYHQSIAAANGLQLETASASFASSYWNSTEPTASQFTLGAPATAVNASGGTYVAYLFAHDASTDGIIQCGSFTTDGSGNANITLGWEPQYLMVKASSTTLNWQVVDSSREFTVGNDNVLSPNTTTAEGVTVVANPTATGFYATTTASQTFIYLAIRRPNKPPTIGTQVYNAIARTGTGAATTVTGVGFAPDLTLSQQRAAVQGSVWYDRLRGAKQYLTPTSTGVEGTNANAVTAFGMDGFSLGTEASVNGALSLIHHFFKRAPGVFDEVCYTGTGATANISHGLGVAPELLIVKSRSNAGQNWTIYHAAEGPTKFGFLTNTNFSAFTYWNNTSPTSSVFTVGGYGDTNGAAITYVAYLFATKAGISKVGSYTGNGSSLTLNMGFTTGARFFLCKRTDSTGDWYVFDTTRGIIAGNDGHLSLNTTAAEVTTDDSVDPDTSGLIVNQVAATNINVTSATYIYLAFA